MYLSTCRNQTLNFYYYELLSTEESTFVSHQTIIIIGNKVFPVRAFQYIHAVFKMKIFEFYVRKL